MIWLGVLIGLMVGTPLGFLICGLAVAGAEPERRP